MVYNVCHLPQKREGLGGFLETISVDLLVACPHFVVVTSRLFQWHLHVLEKNQSCKILYQCQLITTGQKIKLISALERSIMTVFHLRPRHSTNHTLFKII